MDISTDECSSVTVVRQLSTRFLVASRYTVAHVTQLFVADAQLAEPVDWAAFWIKLVHVVANYVGQPEAILSRRSMDLALQCSSWSKEAVVSALALQGGRSVQNLEAGVMCLLWNMF